ncbi:MAG TPA: NTP transferase domain-containing protein [Pseudoxanthomonas sp.]|nr:NTP transferase domain-containing protein [Pseudoxanthomonas sp.]
MLLPLPVLHGLVMTGGHSTRMGEDKALIHYGDEPQLLATFRLLQPHVAACFVSMREGQRTEPARHALPAIVDTVHGIGPAAGLLAAHAAHPEAAWLVVACDLPLLQASTLAALFDARDGRHAAIAYMDVEDGFAEPLCTVWEPEALHALARQAGEGRYGLRAALAQIATLLLPTPADRSLLNINTTQERAELETSQASNAPS